MLFGGGRPLLAALARSGNKFSHPQRSEGGVL
jgi:hypothetical protein